MSSMDEEMIISFCERGAMLSSVTMNLVPSETMSVPAAIAPAIACPLLTAPARMRVFSPTMGRNSPRNANGL
jgi:hypothetical protein